MSGWVDRGDTEYGPKLEWESEEPTREEWLAAMQVEEQLIAQGRWDELVWEPDGDYSGLDQNAHGGLPEECPHCGKRLVIAKESGAMRKTKFQLDGLEGEFEGYTKDEDWNGFSCPYFDEETATTLLDAMTATGGWDYTFNPFVPAFHVACLQTDDEDVTEFAGMNTEHGILYAIGAFYWCWSEVEAD